MLRIKAFQGLRPTPELAHLVACVPYDVVDRAEAAALAKGNPDSLLHVDRAEIDLPETTDPYWPEVYAKALENFRAMQAKGVLIRESEPCVYLYRQRMGDHSQTGIAALCHIDDYEQDIIKKHEKTRRDKEDDRTRLIDTLSAETGPVFLTYRDSPKIGAFVTGTTATPPFFDFTAPDGIRHTVWRVSGAEELTRLFRRNSGGVCRGWAPSHGQRGAGRQGTPRGESEPHGPRKLQLVPRGALPGERIENPPVQSHGARSERPRARRFSGKSARRVLRPGERFGHARPPRPHRDVPGLPLVWAELGSRPARRPGLATRCLRAAGADSLLPCSESTIRAPASASISSAASAARAS